MNLRYISAPKKKAGEHSKEKIAWLKSHLEWMVGILEGPTLTYLSEPIPQKSLCHPMLLVGENVDSPKSLYSLHILRDMFQLYIQ